MTGDPNTETLERRVYARMDETLGPINEAIDALNTRITTMGEMYEELLRRTNIATTETPDARLLAFETRQRALDTILDQQEERWERYDHDRRNNTLQFEGLARDIVEMGQRLDVERDGRHVLGKRVDEHAAILNSTTTALVGRISALEDRPRQDPEWYERIRNDHTTLLALLGRVAALEERTRPGAATPEVFAEADATYWARMHAEKDARRAARTIHDIGWAVAQLRAGKRVRRAEWPEGSYYQADAAGDLVSIFWRCGKLGPCSFYTNLEELSATDWELAP